MTVIAELLRARTAPGVDGLFRRGVGPSYQVVIDGPTLRRFEIGQPFDHDDWDADPDALVEIDPAVRLPLPGGGSVCCGEGPLGADGFFAREDGDGAVVWVVVLTRSNPFVRAEVDGRTATFTNNLGHSLTIDLTDPHFACD
jgi:hypothetical protein